MPTTASINEHFAERARWEGRLKLVIAAAATIDGGNVNGGALADACIVSALQVILKASGWQANSEAQLKAMVKHLRRSILTTLADEGPAELSAALANSSIDNN